MKSILSILIAGLTLIATSGISVNKHYCGNHLASISLLGDGGCTCGVMEDEANCCHTERSFFHVDDDFSVTPVHTLTVQQASMLTILVCNLSVDFNTNEAFASFKHYKPPIPDKDIPVLIQSFLI